MFEEIKKAISEKIHGIDSKPQFPIIIFKRGKIEKINKDSLKNNEIFLDDSNKNLIWFNNGEFFKLVLCEPYNVSIENIVNGISCVKESICGIGLKTRLCLKNAIDISGYDFLYGEIIFEKNTNKLYCCFSDGLKEVCCGKEINFALNGVDGVTYFDKVNNGLLIKNNDKAVLLGKFIKVDA